MAECTSRERSRSPKRGEASDSKQDASTSSLAELDNLWATVQQRKCEAAASSSWTAKLLSKGPDKCAQKVGEEAVEICIEAAARRNEGVVKESADLLYHLFVLWTSLGVEPGEVLDELRKREGVSGIAEKASRPK